MPAPKAEVKPKAEKKWSTIEGSKGLSYVESDSNSNVMVKFDSAKDFGLSKSEKTVIVATCGRPKEIILKDGSSIFLNFTAYKYPTPK